MRFGCFAGEAVALWKSSRVIPIQGREYDVELDVDTVLTIGGNATIERGLRPNLSVHGTQVQITGTVERIDPDNLVLLRLMPDCLLMVETTGSTFPCGAAVRFAVEPTALWLTPFGA